MKPAAASAVVAIVLFHVTAASVLLPSIRLDLGSSSSGGQWVLNAYLLALAALLPVLAGLALPRRALVAIGALAMAAGAVVSASADTTSTLVIGQAVTGAGAAALLASPRGGLPAGLRLPALALPVLALVLGPAAGGVFGEQNWWRLFFWAGVPLAALAAAAALLAPGAGRRPPADGLGRALAFAAGLVALTIVLVQSEPWGLGSASVIALLIIVPIATLPAALASRHPTPVSIWFAVAASLAALCFLAPQYFELAHLLAPLHSGALLSVLTGSAVAGGLAGWRLGSAVSRRVLAIAGAVVAAAGLIALGALDPHSGYALMALAMVLTGGGLGVAAGAVAGEAPSDALALVPAGAALGLAAAGAVFQHVQADNRSQGDSFAEALTHGVSVGALSLIAFASAAAGTAWFQGRRARPESSAARPAAES